MSKPSSDIKAPQEGQLIHSLYNYVQSFEQACLLTLSYDWEFLV